MVDKEKIITLIETLNKQSKTEELKVLFITLRSSNTMLYKYIVSEYKELVESLKCN